MLGGAELNEHSSPMPGVGIMTNSLLSIVQELSHARTVDSIIGVVRDMARQLTGAAGVTFVLRDGDQCYYVEENAIGPLWKGRRFPMRTCVSGWAMLHSEPAIIEDIFSDPRIPVDAYAPTFVKSLVMVPIRRGKPIGAIGAYWDVKRRASEAEVAMLQALADSVSVAMENVSLYAELQTKVKELQESNHELSRFAWIASHDLQEPLRTITTQVQMLSRRYNDKLDVRGQNYIRTVSGSATRLQNLVEDLLVHARIERSEHFKPLVIDEVIKNIQRDMHIMILENNATITTSEMPWLWGEEVMIHRMFQNLIHNAIKFHKPGVPPTVHISCLRDEGNWHFMISDNGIGIPKDQIDRVFGLFQRIHTQAAYPGSGIGLATCKKIAELHKGRIWVESVPDEGSTFHIVLPLTGEDLQN